METGRHPVNGNSILKGYHQQERIGTVSLERAGRKEQKRPIIECRLREKGCTDSRAYGG